MEIIALILSILSTVCACITSLIKGKNMKLILLLLFLANVLIAVSYVLTESYTGAATCFVGAAQTIINYFFDKNNKKIPIWLIITYAASFIIINLLVFSKIWDLLSMIAALTFVASIIQKNGKMYRVWSTGNILLWILYDLACAKSQLLTHLFQLGMKVVGIIMHDVKKNKCD